MNHYVYQFLWRKKGYENWASASGLHSGSVTSLFEEARRQPEEWCFTAIVEISETEYYQAKARGMIG